MPSADTPGIPPTEVPRPDEDLGVVTLSLAPAGVGGAIMLTTADYAAAGRIFKWLMGQSQLAREAQP